MVVTGRRHLGAADAWQPRLPADRAGDRRLRGRHRRSPTWWNCWWRRRTGAASSTVRSCRALPDADAVMLSVGIVGATVMPHALYLHSSLTQNRMPARDDRPSGGRCCASPTWRWWWRWAWPGWSTWRWWRWPPPRSTRAIRKWPRSRPPITRWCRCWAAAAALVFVLSLLASGYSSSIVGTMAGQVIMQDFVGFRIPIWLRRAGHHGAGLRAGRARRQRDPVAGVEPGGAEPGAAGADGGAGGADRRQAR